LILHFTVSVFSPIVGGQAETTNGSTLRRVTQLWVSTKVSHDNNFVEGHEEPFFATDFVNVRDTTRAEAKGQAHLFFDQIGKSTAIALGK